MRDEGVTKYQCIFNRTTAPAAALVAELNSVRHELFTKGLIGVYPDGIGYGNVSVRIKEGQEKFIITGTQTGHKPHLEPADFSLVTGYDIALNEVQCEGLIAASSESMTHAAVYELDENIRAVIHVHSRLLWERGRDTCPMTEPTVPYGTPQMAYEMRRLYEKTDLRKKKILLMLGHEEGVITFGADLREALRVLFAALAIRRPEATSFPR
jgi:L-ribulose-5-phosphate 4-epimerase